MGGNWAVLRTFLVCAALLSPSLAQSQSSNAFPWLTGLPPPPGNTCDDVPQTEWVKFRRCSLQSSEALERQREEQRRLAEEAAAAERAAAWSFLLPRPLANCEDLPRAEYPKFSCAAPEEDVSAILAGELGVIMAARDDLRARYDALRDRESRISLREDSLANDALRARLDQLKAVESALSGLTEKRALLDRLSTADPANREGGNLRFARVVADASVFASGSDAQTLGRLPARTMVIAMGSNDETRFVQIFHQNTGYGFVRASDLVPPEY